MDTRHWRKAKNLKEPKTTGRNESEKEKIQRQKMPRENFKEIIIND